MKIRFYGEGADAQKYKAILTQKAHEVTKLISHLVEKEYDALFTQTNQKYLRGEIDDITYETILFEKPSTDLKARKLAVKAAAQNTFQNIKHAIAPHGSICFETADKPIAEMVFEPKSLHRQYEMFVEDTFADDEEEKTLLSFIRQQGEARLEELTFVGNRQKLFRMIDWLKMKGKIYEQRKFVFVPLGENG
jgi:hypothetical protein